jgi:hypothetical protein
LSRHLWLSGRKFRIERLFGSVEEALTWAKRYDGGVMLFIS